MMYIAAHRDYVRTVRLLPQGPEKVELIVEDAEMCELNQKGLHSLRHLQGALVEQEYETRDFHHWLRGRLGES